MAQRKVVTTVCDFCDGEDLVKKHTVAVDGHVVEVDADEGCWQGVLGNFAAVARVGRRVKQTKVKKRDVMPFPGTAWHITSHALIRLGERHIDVLEAARAADDPQVRRPGRERGTEVRQRDNVKVVVKESQQRILTVSRPDEEDE